MDPKAQSGEVKTGLPPDCASIKGVDLIQSERIKP